MAPTSAPTPPAEAKWTPISRLEAEGWTPEPPRSAADRFRYWTKDGSDGAGYMITVDTEITYGRWGTPVVVTVTTGSGKTVYPIQSYSRTSLDHIIRDSQLWRISELWSPWRRLMIFSRHPEVIAWLAAEHTHREITAAETALATSPPGITVDAETWKKLTRNLYSAAGCLNQTDGETSPERIAELMERVVMAYDAIRDATADSHG